MRVAALVLLVAFGVAACSDRGSNATGAATTVSAAHAEHVVTLALHDATEPQMRRAAAERCQSDETVTAVAVTSTSGTRDGGLADELSVSAQFRCDDLP